MLSIDSPDYVICDKLDFINVTLDPCCYFCSIFTVVSLCYSFAIYIR